MRILLTCLLAALVAAPAFAQTQIAVGVRADAPPFSYADEDSDGGYNGYIVQVCRKVLEAIGAPFVFEPVQPSKRFDALRSGQINILCDPATINQARLEDPAVMVSQPIYISGIGVAKAARDKPFRGHLLCIGPIVGVVEGTTARSAIIQEMAEDNRFGVQYSKQVLAHPTLDKITLSEPEAARVPRCEEAARQDRMDLARLAPEEDRGTHPAIKSYVDHYALAEAVCDQEVLYSVGDLEIIAAALKRVENCAFEIEPDVTSEERYGIFVRVSQDMTEQDKVALAFLRQLPIEIHKGRDSVLLQSFRDHFDASEISRSLNLFFWSVVADDK